MKGYENNDKNMHPKDLCKKCGRCCRVVTNPDYTYQQLQNMATDGDEYAKDFINIFKPYPSIEMARKADFMLVDNIIGWLKSEQKYDENTLTFYKCKYLLDNNMCSIYEERPSLCVWNLLNGWGFIPSGCGFESWMFMRREEDMQKIRHAKEELLDLKVMKSKTKDEKILQKIESVEKKIFATIDMYSKYGSYRW